MIQNGKNSPANVTQAFDEIRNDYEMSRDTRFVRRRTGLAPQGGSADWHYRTEQAYYRDIEKARDMDRNDSVIGQIIDRAVDNIVQGGFTLDPKTGDKKLDQDLSARWKDWSEDRDQCDIAGEYCFHDYETLSCRGVFADGDCVNLGLNGGQLQHLEAHTIQTTTRIDDTVLGVTKDRFGKRLQYWVQVDPVTPNERKEQAQPVDVRNSEGMRTLFHVYNAKRMNQTRGVTALAPVFSLAGMFEDIQFAKLVQQQVASCFAVFRKREYIPDLPGTATDGYGQPSTETTSSGTRYIEDIAPGMEIIGEPGEELQGFSPNVPNTEYFPHVKLIMQMIGVNLGLPLCLVLMDGSETNFSGWRGAVDEARKGFRRHQHNLIDRFHVPLYRWKVSQWLAIDPALRRAAEKPRISIAAHKWNVPAWAYIDPVGDAQGDALRLQNGLVSPRALHAERGREWDEVSSESIEDNSQAIIKAKKAAASINKKFPEDPPVQWRELISLPMPTGIQMTMQDPNVVEMQSMEARDAEEPADV